MKLKNMSIAELEMFSYTDLTYMLLEENKKPMNTPNIFKEICNLLGYNDDEYANRIGDYYTSLTTDKRFVLLDNTEWDLRDRHSIEVIMDEEDEDDAVEEESEDEELDDEIEEDIDAMIEDDELEEDDDLDELALVDEDDLSDDN